MYSAFLLFHMWVHSNRKIKHYSSKISFNYHSPILDLESSLLSILSTTSSSIFLCISIYLQICRYRYRYIDIVGFKGETPFFKISQCALTLFPYQYILIVFILYNYYLVCHNMNVFCPVKLSSFAGQLDCSFSLFLL